MLATGLCLLVLTLGLGVIAAVLNRATDHRRRRPGGRSLTHTGVPSPARRPGEGPLWAGAEVDDAEPTANGGPPPPAVALPYVRERPLLTHAEGQFFSVLRAAAPEGWPVFAQVRLASLIRPRDGAPSWRAHYGRVAQKCVDFVLCDPADFSPRLVVELDDSSHDRPSRQDRDEFVDAALRAAGLPILHVRWQRHYDVATLTGKVRAAAGLPSAPRPAHAPPAGAAAPVGAGVPAGAASTSSLPASSGRAPRWACRSCSAEVSATAKFCTACGAPLEL